MIIRIVRCGAPTITDYMNLNNDIVVNINFLQKVNNTSELYIYFFYIKIIVL